jgi:hypothetical protein
MPKPGQTRSNIMLFGSQVGYWFTLNQQRPVAKGMGSARLQALMHSGWLSSPLRHTLAPLRPHSGATRMFIRWLHCNVYADFGCNIYLIGKMLYISSLCYVFVDFE